MKHNTFEPCKDHENGHFNWCLLCEIEQLRNTVKELTKIEVKYRELVSAIKEYNSFNPIQFHVD